MGKPCKIAVLIFIFLLAGCFPRAELIKDVTELSQDHALYYKNALKSEAVFTQQVQRQYDEDYNIIHFSMWHQREPFHARPERVVLDFQKFKKTPGFGENRIRHTTAWIKKLEQNASLSGYPNALYPAITTRNTNMRVLPTQGAHFSSPNADSSGWPFDNMQRSAVAANTPIFVCHISADKSWALVETSFTFGWIPIEDSAMVDEAFIRQWDTGRYAVITANQTSVLDENEKFILRASIGHIFPLVREMPEKLTILVAAADENGNAVIKNGFVPREQAAVKPLRFNYDNVTKIANELLGEAYGWGGLYGNRDCSAMTRDFFAPFGIWLPRHSADQVNEVGQYFDLRGLTAEEKEKMIIEQGLPYLSLLWFRGHVMLYIGQKNGQALVFHNIWGIRIKDETGTNGRKIIGQSVITTLRPGAELDGIDILDGYLIDKIAAMNVLVPVQSGPSGSASD
ncbi:MAG TPA: SH3 domain-containing protein [Smithellaceae bacterium]|nr:SH3 domain-containing protein [Smithellaceae bacterium]HRS88120.1 SH3 domain-containing protein [Smithellaceae bacterium]HRV25406.1 SH3 domain-containing protein [Smithellaceae bacterium]